MPELPEVETTRRGIAPRLTGQQVCTITVREPRLRWPVPESVSRQLPGQPILAVERRGKYLLARTPGGTLLLHLGMSGSLRFTHPDDPWRTHDHVELRLEDGGALRFNDPRRFGALLWTTDDPACHPLLAGLGPEPLSEAFSADYLQQRARGRRMAIKPLLMDGRIVVGVGNIYASEALFRAGIRPTRAAGRIAAARFPLLVEAIRDVLEAAIEAGGTTLRDFHNGEGKPGYFGRQIQVYGRAGQPCLSCGGPVKSARLGQRSTFWCPGCQR
ncbi:MAG: bifunctional DNA-formamidopyrimidine glycosylase/DNA-(apurinic or apyrimidinic site) lyase [Chromatiales bacterium]|nr:bifunctional DNA-formamidopyrimidine glycosylase/DNA-(apurinic or apyrimidinic site) lyase [Chromatiales bacterium]